MQTTSVLIGLLCALVITSVGFFAVPFVFAERILPGVMLDDNMLTGVTTETLPSVVEKYSQQFQDQTITVKLRERIMKYRLGDLGASVDVAATSKRIAETNSLHIIEGQRRVRPVVQIDRAKLTAIAQKDFATLVTFPRDATLRLTSTGQFELIPSRIGEGVDLVAFARDVEDRVRSQAWDETIDLGVIAEAPAVQDNEVQDARDFATNLLRDGFTVTNGDQSWSIKPFTIKRLLSFVQRVNPETKQASLGVTFQEAELASYLTKTLSPDIDQEARDARFSRVDDRVEQFDTPQEGRKLNIDDSVKKINGAVANGTTSSALVVDMTEPNVREVADINTLGVGKLIATGQTNFSGSPANRRFNIAVGVSRFHGLLIAPGQEFSFLEHLGPVDGEHGFKKELVIKTNVTVPEFGGGLCQVSTTVFRAAVQAGLEITQRRNHAYVVKYYGKPGFDATIYPPYTDFRFINNTPGYILIQARVDGNNVIFEFWGTDDGRVVSVTGPASYDWQPDGSVKATLTEHVVKADGSVLLDKVFRSNYKSPSLFPHELTTDASKAAVPTPAPTPTPTADKPAQTNDNNKSKPTPTASPTAHPAASASTGR